MTMTKKLFQQHLLTQQERIGRALQECSLDGLVISSGVPFTYFADDHDAPFHPTPHFFHWCPEASPYHLLHLRPGHKPKLIFYSPKDFWYEPPSLSSCEWADEFEVHQIDDHKKRWQVLGDLSNHAFIGSEEKEAAEKKLLVNPSNLKFRLDWSRTEKTPYEIYCLEKASELGAQGHLAARAAFENGASEIEAHIAFLAAVGVREEDLPYTNIVGMDEKSAFLHYQQKRDKTQMRPAKVMLIDAGAKFQGYCSDITRTIVKSNAHPLFKSLLASLEKAQQELCGLVKDGVSFKDLHKQCHLKIAKILLDAEIIKNCTAEAAMKESLTKIFLPHGLGHMLGIQVHDVGGDQANASGDPVPVDKEFPTLRTRRSLRTNEVVTIEPGLYFIPVLLESIRQKELGRYCQWSLIDELVPCGGVRIEDNVVVEKGQSRNLTRQFLRN